MMSNMDCPESVPGIAGGNAYPRVTTLVKEKRFSVALFELDALIKENPDAASAYNELGVLHFQLADKEKAFAGFQKAVQLAPANISFRKNLAYFCFSELNRHEDALKIYTGILAEEPADVETLLAIGAICNALGNRKDAFFFYKKVIAVEPWNSTVWQFMEAFFEYRLAEYSESTACGKTTGLNKQQISIETIDELTRASRKLECGNGNKPEGSAGSGPNSLNGITSNHALTPPVSIVIPLFNAGELTRKCLAALEATTDRSLYELILVDNNSTDNTVELLAELPKDVKIIRNEQNLGFARACNQGAQAASGSYVLFLNNDTEPQSGWLEPMIAMIESEDSIGAVGSKLLFPDGTIQHAGVVVIEDHKMPDLLVARHVFYGQPADTPDANRPMEFKVLTAACLMVRRNLFIDVGGFDEGYWNGYEDVDLCFKLAEKGWRLAYQPTSVLIHHESKSGKERFSKVEHNIKRLHEKWLGKVRPDAVIDKEGAWRWIQDDASWHVQSEPSAPLGTQSSYTPGLVSIVILTFNQLQFTKECVASIQKQTPEPHEIIFIDNGSTDGTVAWLKKQVRHNDGYRLIDNGSNFGFARGCNQGIEAAQGEYILLLNNDVVVTGGWLEGMLECLQRQPDGGIVGPMTNNISGLQRVAGVGYEDMTGLERYAASFRKSSRYRRVETRRIVGFCMLFRHELADRIGLLDECFGSGNFEDDDYCLRAELAGYHNVIAADVFIHHYGSQSFIGNNINYTDAMMRNMALYRTKWNYSTLDEAMLRCLIPLDAVREARRLFTGADTEAAIELLIHKGIRVAPENVAPYVELAEILMATARYEEALQVLPEMPAGTNQAIKRTIEAVCHAALGNDKAAQQAALQAPGTPRALVVLGTLAARQSNLVEAESLFRRAVAVDPSCGSGWLSLGMLLWGKGDQEGAYQAIRRAVVVDPLDNEAVRIFRDMAGRNSSQADALQVISEAALLYPDSRNLGRHHAELLAQCGRDREALEACEAFLVSFGLDEELLSLALQLRQHIGTCDRLAESDNRSISLCMIVKNEEKNLPACLASLKPVVDEMIVVDTGSTDRTVDIATAFGARVLSFPWNGNFSDARNFSLAAAQGRWILVMDADEVLSRQDYDTVRQAVQPRENKAIVWSVMTRNYTRLHPEQWIANDGSYPREERAQGWHPSTKVRLFPNDVQIRFVGEVHEMIEPTAQKAGYQTREAPFVVHHYGGLADTEAGDRAKKEAYYELGKQKLVEHPCDLPAIGELAVQAAELDLFAEAISLWDRFLGLAPEAAVALFNKGFALMRLDRFSEALEATRRVLKVEPFHKEAAFNYGVCALYAGDLNEAINRLESVLRKHPAHPPLLAVLSVLHLAAGDRKEAGVHLQELKRINYSISDFIAGRIEVLRRIGRNEYADALEDSCKRAAVK